MITLTPEFIAVLENAFVAAAQRMGLAPTISPERDVWLTTRETCAFLRLSPSSFQRFKTRNEAKLTVSTGINASEPRYLLASLEKIMREDAVGGAEPTAPAPSPVAQVNPAALPPAPAPRKPLARPRAKITPFPRRSADVRTPEAHVTSGTLF